MCFLGKMMLLTKNNIKTLNYNTPPLSCPGQIIPKKIRRNLPISNPRPDLHNINAHTKFGENPLMFTRVKLSSGNKKWMDGRTDRRMI